MVKATGHACGSMNRNRPEATFHRPVSAVQSRRSEVEMIAVGDARPVAKNDHLRGQASAWNGKDAGILFTVIVGDAAGREA